MAPNAALLDRGGGRDLLQSWPVTILSFLSSLTVILYVLLRLAYSAYYSAFGIKPEDVGLAQTDILIQSALGVGLAVAATAVLMMLNWLLIRVIFWQIMWALQFNMWVYYRRRPARPGSSLSYRALLVEYMRRRSAGAAGVSALSIPRRTRDELEQKWESLSRISQRIVSWGFKLSSAGGSVALIYSALTGALLITAIFVVAVQVAQFDATAVKSGTPRHVSVGPFQLTSWGADTVKAENNAALYKFPATCLMYLGQANGITVLYDPTLRHTVRIPSAAVVITSEERCG